MHSFYIVILLHVFNMIRKRSQETEVFEHNSVVEQDTREKFDLILALHLWDFSYDA